MNIILNALMLNGCCIVRYMHSCSSIGIPPPKKKIKKTPEKGRLFNTLRAPWLSSIETAYR